MEQYNGGMEHPETGAKPPLAQLSSPEELKARYQCFSDETLLKWRDVVTGAHKRAMEAILTERGAG